LSEEIAHRPERVVAVLGINQSDILTPALGSRLMMSEEGGIKDIPEMARVYVLITHVTEERRDGVREVACLVRGSGKTPDVFCLEQRGEWFSI